MTKLETTIRRVSDLRDFYIKIKKKSKNPKAGAKVSRVPGASQISLHP